jgi:DNA transposition AAA+ family ATPase
MKNTIRIDASHPVVSRLIELQGSDSDKAFATEKLSISETVWYRIKAGKYQAEDHSRVLRKISHDLADILDNHQIAGSINKKRILPLSHITDTRDALNMAFSDERNRIVIVLADTGGGKTMIARSIERDFASRVAKVEATETWRKSYLAGIHDISIASGIEKPSDNTRVAQNDLISTHKDAPRIVVIDEGNYFGAACLNLVKTIVNQTPSIVVILAMPVLWKTITKNSNQEARQLRNRAAAILEFKKVKPSDVRIAMEETVPNWKSLNGSSTAAISTITDTANNFGLWNTVFSIAEFITEEAGDGDLTLDIVQRAATDVYKLRATEEAMKLRN